MRAVALALLASCRQPSPPTTVVHQTPAQTPGVPDATAEPVPQQHVGSQAEIAARLMAEGEAAFANKAYADATARFREAVARAPAPRSFLALCQSLMYEDKLGEAKPACEAVMANKPSAELRRYAQSMLDYMRIISSPASTPATPRSGTQADIARDLHTEGEFAYAQKLYANASSKFREAVARVPEAKYFLSLCRSLFKEGKFSEAMTSCDAVKSSNPTPAVRDEAARLMTTIRAEARAQKLDLGP